MVDHLEVPETLACIRLERQHAMGEPILADAIAAPMIVGRRARTRKYHPALQANRHAAPATGATHRLPRVGWQRFVAEFARVRDGVENPAPLSRARVKRPNVTGRGGIGTFTNNGTQDEQVLMD